jgi:hypothetical protein
MRHNGLKQPRDSFRADDPSQLRAVSAQFQARLFFPAWQGRHPGWNWVSTHTVSLNLMSGAFARTIFTHRSLEGDRVRVAKNGFLLGVCCSNEPSDESAARRGGFKESIDSCTWIVRCMNRWVLDVRRLGGNGPLLSVGAGG